VGSEGAVISAEVTSWFQDAACRLKLCLMHTSALCVRWGRVQIHLYELMSYIQVQLLLNKALSSEVVCQC
jgi:hypothetical protein